MFDAYNHGLLGDFLSRDFTANKQIHENKIAPAPVRTKVIRERPVYDYTRRNYSDFMTAFSLYIEAQNPFKQLEH